MLHVHNIDPSPMNSCIRNGASYPYPPSGNWTLILQLYSPLPGSWMVIVSLVGWCVVAPDPVHLTLTLEYSLTSVTHADTLARISWLNHYSVIMLSRVIKFKLIQYRKSSFWTLTSRHIHFRSFWCYFGQIEMALGNDGFVRELVLPKHLTPSPHQP